VKVFPVACNKTDVKIIIATLKIYTLGNILATNNIRGFL